MSDGKIFGLPARPPQRFDGDLRLVLSFTALAVVLTVLPLPDPLRTVVLLPFVLAVPGYALAALLFPPGFVSRDERVVLTVTFGVSVAALGGLVVAAVGLDRWTWLALLVLATAAATILAQLRRETLPAPAERPPRAIGRPARATLAPLAAAAVLAVVAIAVASSGANDQLDRSRFSSVWLVPVDAATAAPGAPLELGVANHEDEAVRYRLLLISGAAASRSWDFELDADEEWRQQLAAPAAEPGRPLVASLFRDGVRYRRVALEVQEEE